MEHIDNRPEQIAKRKAQNSLIVVGTGTILFGVWSGIKLFGGIIMLRNETIADFKQVIVADYTVITDNVLFIAILLIAFVMFAIDILLRTYVGLAAISEGRGRKRNALYLLVAVIMTIFLLLGIEHALTAPGDIAVIGALMPRVTFSSIFIDLTSAIMLIEMVAAAVKIRKLARAEKQAQKKMGE